MQTINEAVSRLRNSIKAVKQDSLLSSRFLYSMIMKHGKLLMRRQDSLNRIMRFNSIFQTLNYVELVDVDVAEAECFGVSTGCTIKRTKDKLPEGIEGYYGPLLRTVSSLDLSQQVTPTFPITYQQMSKQRTFRYNSKKYYWYLNGYLYLPNVEWDAIKVEGVFQGSLQGYSCDTDDNCSKMKDRIINIPEFLFSEIEQLVMRDLGIMLQVPAEPGQDAKNITS